MKILSKDFVRSFLLPHGLIILVFGFLSLAFYYPLLEGKILIQSDIRQYEGMSRELNDYRTETREETYWINNAFGGMPTYQLGAKYPADFLSPIYSFIRILPRPAHILFLYFMGAYLLLLVIKMPYRIAFFGALAFGFSSASASSFAAASASGASSSTNAFISFKEGGRPRKSKDNLRTNFSLEASFEC